VCVFIAVLLLKDYYTACVFFKAVRVGEGNSGGHVSLLLQDLLSIIKLCARGWRGTVKDICYEVRRAEACVD
jgi:hypothetical protein